MERFKKGEPLRLSRWTHLFFKKETGYFALYNSLTFDVIFLEKKYFQLVKILKNGTIPDFLIKRLKVFSEREIMDLLKELYKAKLICYLKEDDTELLRKKILENIFPVGLEALYLIVTDNCNLRCKYCLINNNIPQDYKFSKMKWEVAKEAVDMFFLNIQKNPPEYKDVVKTIIFYGGEPLLNFHLIKKVICYVKDNYKDELRELGNSFRFAIITNGTVIDEGIAKFFRDNKNISISISLDGISSVNDKKRIFAGGEGAFKETMRGYNLLKSVGHRNNIAISCTIDSHNINNLPDLLEMQKKYLFKSVNLNLLLNTNKKIVSKSYSILASKKIIEYFLLAREAGVYEDRMVRKINAFANKEIHAYDCLATGSQIVCSPDGQIGVCHEGIGLKDFFFGKISKDFSFHDNPTINEWKKRSPLCMPQCLDCSALGLCGGGCAYSAYVKNGSIWSIDDRFCPHSLLTLKWLIWDLFDKI